MRWSSFWLELIGFDEWLEKLSPSTILVLWSGIVTNSSISWDTTAYLLLVSWCELLIFFSSGLGERLEFERSRLEEGLDDREPEADFIVVGEWFYGKSIMKYVIRNRDVKFVFVLFNKIKRKNEMNNYRTVRIIVMKKYTGLKNV